MRTSINHSLASRAKQRGAVLIVSLLLLLVMTILALSMSQTTRLQQRQAGNYRDYELAFQAAETALREAEWKLENQGAPVPCSAPNNDPSTCLAIEQGALLDIALHQQSEAWWATNAKEYGAQGTQELADLYKDPQYIIERWGDEGDYDGLDIGRGGEQRREYFKVTSHAYGRGSNTEAMTESVFAVQPK